MGVGIFREGTTGVHRGGDYGNYARAGKYSITLEALLDFTDGIIAFRCVYNP